MTIPEHIREEAKSCYLNCEQMDSYGIIETIATALLAAEQRGMERAAEIGYATCAKTRHVKLGDEVADAIRKAREERG